MSPRGKTSRLVWISGAGALTVLALAAASWKDLLVRYHLQRLRGDSAALPAFLEEPDGAAERLAASAFAREPAGREAVVGLFLTWFEEARDRDSALHQRLGGFQGGIVGLRRSRFDRFLDCQGFWYHLQWVKGKTAGSVWDAPRGSGVLADLMMDLRGARLELRGHAGLAVEILPLHEALDRTGSWSPPVIDPRTDGSARLLDFALLLSRAADPQTSSSGAAASPNLPGRHSTLSISDR